MDQLLGECQHDEVVALVDSLEKLVRDAPPLTIMDGTNDTLLLEAMAHLRPTAGA